MLNLRRDSKPVLGSLQQRTPRRGLSRVVSKLVPRERDFTVPHDRHSRSNLIEGVMARSHVQETGLP